MSLLTKIAATYRCTRYCYPTLWCGIMDSTWSVILYTASQIHFLQVTLTCWAWQIVWIYLSDTACSKARSIIWSLYCLQCKLYTPHELLDWTSALHNELRRTSCMCLAKRYKLKEDSSNNVNHTKTYIWLPGTCLVFPVKIACHAIVCMAAERQRKSKTSTDACINPNCPNNPKHTRCELIKHSNVATWVSKSHLLM